MKHRVHCTFTVWQRCRGLEYFDQIRYVTQYIAIRMLLTL